ncbi:LysR family transcriptional regulator [Asaia astilbis]|uniref:LysR family transcriptional regulator n=1 Tax=Asaia astilbis TaxID=610244 RepID=UPI000AE2822C|nr:LysR family transcriptional regulator [Asaia astilbis]
MPDNAGEEDGRIKPLTSAAFDDISKYRLSRSKNESTLLPVFTRFLRYFMAVSQHGSIRRASDALGISASSIDRQILLGEEALGTSLFERLPSGLRLTSSGAVLLVQAKRWHREFQDCRAQIDDLKGLKRGHVTLLIPEAMARGMVPEVIAALRVTHPGISLSVRVMTNHDIAPALIEGRGDLALIFDPSATARLSVRARAVFPLGLVTRPDHPLAKLDEARFSLCASYDVIAPSAPLALAQKIEWLVSETGQALNSVCESDDIEMIKSLIRNGVGISILSYVDVVQDVRSGSLAFVPFSNRKIRPFELSFCVDQARSLPMAARVVAQALEAAFPGLSPPLRDGDPDADQPS